MKSKFGSFDFGSVEVLSRAEEAKVKGGAYGSTTYSGAYLDTYDCICSQGYSQATTTVQAYSCAAAKDMCGTACFNGGYYASKTAYKGVRC